MNAMMIKKLIERDIIRQGTEIEVFHYGHGLSCQSDVLTKGTFSIQSASVISDGANIIFTGRSQETGKICRFESEQIMTLDGMTADRLAAIYSMTEDGEEIKQGKRRGRRPKAQILAMEEQARQEAEAQDEQRMVA